MEHEPPKIAMSPNGKLTGAVPTCIKKSDVGTIVLAQQLTTTRDVAVSQVTRGETSEASETSPNLIRYAHDVARPVCRQWQPPISNTPTITLRHARLLRRLRIPHPPLRCVHLGHHPAHARPAEYIVFPPSPPSPSTCTASDGQLLQAISAKR